ATSSGESYPITKQTITYTKQYAYATNSKRQRAFGFLNLVPKDKERYPDLAKKINANWLWRCKLLFAHNNAQQINHSERGVQELLQLFGPEIWSEIIRNAHKKTLQKPGHNHSVFKRNGKYTIIGARIALL